MHCDTKRALERLASNSAGETSCSRYGQRRLIGKSEASRSRRGGAAIGSQHATRRITCLNYDRPGELCDLRRRCEPLQWNLRLEGSLRLGHTEPLLHCYRTLRKEPLA